MKLFGKKEQAKECAKLPRNLVWGAIIGLIFGICLTFVTGCYQGGWIGYTIAAFLIILTVFFGCWVGKNGGWKLLYHEDVYYRVGGYVAFGLLLFLCSWAIFFFLVAKNGLLSNSFVVQKLLKSQIDTGIGPWGAKAFGETWTIFGKEFDVAETVGVWGNVIVLTLKYFLNHLVFVIPFVFMLNFVKVGKWNLGSIYFALYTIMWGAAVGTRSQLFPTGADLMSGSLLVFARYGIWIWYSYL